MTSLLAQRGGLRMVEYTDTRNLDFGSLARLSERAWQHDYRGVVRIVYDEAYLRWLLGENDWVGAIVHDSRDEPVACEFSMFRTLRIAGESISAGYATQLAVAPDYRRFGLGLWLADWNARLVMERRGRGALVGMLHEGHAAMAGITRLSNNSLWDGVRLSQGPLWQRRLEPAGIDSTTPATRYWSFVRELGLPDLDAISELVEHCPLPTFEVRESLARMYMDARSMRSGTLLCSSPAGPRCAIGYSIHSLALDDQAIGPVGQIQSVHLRDCSPAALTEALREILTVFRRRNCIAACTLNQGHLDTVSLQRAGFSPSPDKIVLVLRTRHEIIRAVRAETPRCVIDLL